MSVQLPYICLHVFLLNAKSNKAEIKCYLKKRKKKKMAQNLQFALTHVLNFPLSAKRENITSGVARETWMVV